MKTSFKEYIKMETAIKGLFKNICQSQLKCVRYKVNITKPRPPHYERALLEHICVPYFDTKRIPRHIPDKESCNVSVVQKAVEENIILPQEFNGENEALVSSLQDHPLKIILAQENLKQFQNSKLVAFFHMNSVNADEKFQYQLLMKKNGMKLLFLSKSILKKAFENTIYEPTLVLYEAPTATAFCPEPNIYSLVKILRKLPKFSLMAGIVENKLLNVNELKNLGKFQDITEARAALISVLNSTSQNLVQQINHHPSTFVELLNQHKKLLGNSGSKS